MGNNKLIGWVDVMPIYYRQLLQCQEHSLHGKVLVMQQHLLSFRIIDNLKRGVVLVGVQICATCSVLLNVYFVPF